MAVSSLVGFGCDNTATTAEKNAACTHFAQLAFDELPSKELLDENAQGERVTFLEKFCADTLDDSSALTSTESACIQDAASLEAVAQCRNDKSLLDRLSPE